MSRFCPRTQSTGQGTLGSGTQAWGQTCPLEAREQPGFPQPSPACQAMVLGWGEPWVDSHPIRDPAAVTEPKKKHLPVFQAFPKGQVVPAHLGDPVRNQRADSQWHVRVFQKQKQSLDPCFSPQPVARHLSQRVGSAQTGHRVCCPGWGTGTGNARWLPRQTSRAISRLLPVSHKATAMASSSSDETQPLGHYRPGLPYPGATPSQSEGAAPTYLWPHVSRLTLQTTAPGRALGDKLWVKGSSAGESWLGGRGVGGRNYQACPVP